MDIDTAEHKRLNEQTGVVPPWHRWGPYVSERSWGTVREDYSAEGNAWGHFPHEKARSKAFRWGEDGIAGICDRYQVLAFGLAFWNEQDRILKERLFGVIPAEGNHGEDVKEYYYYLDSTPTHSYMKYLYKYPQGRYPYEELVDENRSRGGRGFEYELIDTGILHEDKYFDVFVEYAKASPDDILIKITAHNRGAQDAPLHLIPQLWFRNTWGWGKERLPEPVISCGADGKNYVTIVADDSKAPSLPNLRFPYNLGPRYLYAAFDTHTNKPELLFTDNETNVARVYGEGARTDRKFFKDAFHDYVIEGQSSLNPEKRGTKAAVHYSCTVKAQSSVTFTLRLSDKALSAPFEDFDKMMKLRLKEADDFYAKVHPPKASEDEKLVQRQALAGMLWSKQIYLLDVHKWFDGDNPETPPPGSRKKIRNMHWMHLNSMRVISMPDKWEYPWFAAWDLAFHCIALALVDRQFAKEQLWILLFEQFLHPNGQIPAYEWEFSDLNPPVQAWAVWRIYNMEKLATGKGDRDFLEKCFHKLLINFAWWINKVDSQGNNVFEGGFLGLDNITVLDRSEKLPDGVVLEQSDATGWMGMFCLNLMRMALELAKENPVYENLATKFFQHYIYVGAAMKNMGGREYSLWDEDDGFFYDVLRYPDGNFAKFKVRSLVGVIPLYAVERIEEEWIEPFKEFKTNLDWFIKNRQDIVQRCCYPVDRDGEKTNVLAIVDEDQLRRILKRVFSADEFLSPYGIRSLSKTHKDHPFVFGNSEVRYEPAEADCKIKGGNSNWRGPIWFPTTFLIIESLRKLYKAHGKSFTLDVELEGGTQKMTLDALGAEIANRMIRIFTRDEKGNRPVFGGHEKFQKDPHFKDYVLFYEYFHGDEGCGLGASHQTGWTGLIATLIDEWRR